VFSWLFSIDNTVLRFFTQPVLTSLLFHCTQSWYYLWNPTPEIPNTNHKLRLPNGLGTKYLCFTCGQNWKLRNLKFRKAMKCWYRVSAGTPKNEPKMQGFIKLRNLK
jgi:hypothetical protein